ncbi:hypothetical protein TNCV_3788971 [Trichonephila clavipes]|nr:hypothetical protein TNCV_3788971 [Trichonephila clavipes]
MYYNNTSHHGGWSAPRESSGSVARRMLTNMKMLLCICSKMDITPRKRSKIIARNEYTSIRVRDVATAVGVAKDSFSRFLRTSEDSGTSYPKEKE